MKMVKSLLLGSAATFVAAAGAQAADLPMKAKAVEYVKVCSLYGAGYYYIPGTDTCIKIGGMVRFDTVWNGAPSGATAFVTGADARFSRPMFQGKLAAQVRPLGALAIVTLQIGAVRGDSAERGAGAPVVAVDVTIDAAQIRQKPEAPFREAKQAVDLGQAERILAVGRGIKSQENIAIAEQLAKAVGAELAASRPICDNGWLPMERQVGSSGQTVAPKVYMALGISGAIQHLVGMKGSRTIVAINKDAEAPIFEVADYGVVGDLFELAPALITELDKQ